MNLYDLTQGNYRVLRAVSYPDHPGSLIVFEVRVEAKGGSEWITEITISGTYDGPRDIVASDDYQLTWVVDGAKVLEAGSASLSCASGAPMRQIWASIITPEHEAAPRLAKFPSRGEVVEAKISPFKIDGNRMSYEWEGTVKIKPE
jgi:hypothetical protein